MSDTRRFNKNLNSLNTGLQSKLKGGTRKSATDNLRKSRHLLPRHLRRDADRILRAEQTMAHPKLARLAQFGSLEGSFKAIKSHMKGIDPADRRRGQQLGVLGGMVFSVIVVVLLLFAVLAWQGLF